MSKPNRLIKLTRNLIKINSENPPGNEKAIAEYVCNFLKKFKYWPSIVEFSPYRSNVVCTIKSNNSLKRLLLTPHLDTVPAGKGWKIPPFTGKIKANKIYGRGASDCKANVAISLEVLAQLKEAKINLKNLDIIFTATADEETGSDLGLSPLLKKMLPLDYALVLDGSNFAITYAQKGLLHLRVHMFGKKAHGAFPERGINAILLSVKVIQHIKKWIEVLNKKDKAAHVTLNIGKIEGGEKVNIVADSCSMDLDFRFAIDKNLKYFLRQIKGIVAKISKKFSLEVLAFQSPVEMSKKNILINTLKTSLRAKGIAPYMEVSRGATVLNFLADKKITSCVFGCASKKQAHATDEYIEIPHLKKGVAVLKDFLIKLDTYFS